MSKPDKWGGDANHAELNTGETKKETRDAAAGESRWGHDFLAYGIFDIPWFWIVTQFLSGQTLVLNLCAI